MSFTFSTTYNSGVTLSNSNTTAQTNTTNFRRAVGANAISSGKVSFEFTIDQISEGIFLGIISEENPSSSNVFVGASNNSYGIYGQPTNSYISEYVSTSSNVNQDAQLRVGDTVAFTFDADNETLSYAVNGGTVFEITGVPSGTYYPVIGSGSASKKVTSTIAVGQDITTTPTPESPVTNVTEDTDLFKVGNFIKSEISTILDGSTETNEELLNLINLRATTVSLGNVEVRVEALETEIDGGAYS